MKNATLLMLFNFVCFSGISQSFQGAKNYEEVKEVCQEITSKFATENFTDAFDILRNIWILPENEIANLEQQSIKQFNIINGRFGEFIETKFVKSEVIDDLAIEIVFVIKYEFHILRFNYIFYNGKDDLWYLNNFKWDDKIKLLFSGSN